MISCKPLKSTWISSPPKSSSSRRESGQFEVVNKVQIEYTERSMNGTALRRLHPLTHPQGFRVQRIGLADFGLIQNVRGHIHPCALRRSSKRRLAASRAPWQPHAACKLSRLGAIRQVTPPRYQATGQNPRVGRQDQPKLMLAK